MVVNVFHDFQIEGFTYFATTGNYFCNGCSFSLGLQFAGCKQQCKRCKSILLQPVKRKSQICCIKSSEGVNFCIFRSQRGNSVAIGCNKLIFFKSVAICWQESGKNLKKLMKIFGSWVKNDIFEFVKPRLSLRPSEKSKTYRDQSFFKFYFHDRSLYFAKRRPKI